MCQSILNTGIGSDPGKLAEFRALLRMRRAAPELKEDPAFDAFSRLLLKAGLWVVHVAWGLSGEWASCSFQACATRMAGRRDVAGSGPDFLCVSMFL